MKGRHWVALWLTFSLGTLAWVVARQTAAVILAGELSDLREERSALEARRAQQLRRIRIAESRDVLIPRAEDQGLRLPADSEIIILELPVDSSSLE